jgi:hypothetical protein
VAGRVGVVRGCGCGFAEVGVMLADEFLDGLDEVVPQMPAIRDLDRIGGADTNAFGVGAGTVATEDLQIMRRLEKRNLVVRVRSQRLSDVVLLKEDGLREPYVRTSTSPGCSSPTPIGWKSTTRPSACLPRSC